METIKAIVEALKLGIWIVFALSATCCFLLFAPAKWLARLGVAAFVEGHRQWIALALIAGSFICSVWLFTDKGWIRKRLRRRTYRRQLEQCLHRLSEEEKEILRGYIAEQTKTLILSYEDGVVRGLEANRVIARASSLLNLDPRRRELICPYNIQPWAWKYLNAYPEVLA